MKIAPSCCPCINLIGVAILRVFSNPVMLGIVFFAPALHAINIPADSNVLIDNGAVTNAADSYVLSGGNLTISNPGTVFNLPAAYRMDIQAGTLTVQNGATFNAVNTGGIYSVRNAGANSRFLVTGTGTIARFRAGGTSFFALENYTGATTTVTDHAKFELVAEAGSYSGIDNLLATFTISDAATLDSVNFGANGIYNSMSALNVTDGAVLNQTVYNGNGINNSAGTLSVNNATLNTTVAANATSGTIGIHNAADASLIIENNARLIAETNTGIGINNLGNLILSSSTSISNVTAGIGINSVGNLTISGGSFINNVTGGTGIAGGGETGGNVIIANVSFTNNYKGSGIAGISYTYSNENLDNHLTIDQTGGTTFVNNAGGSGNAIYSSTNLNITGGSFINNVTSGNGIYTGNPFSIFDIKITNVNFTNNVTAGTGIRNDTTRLFYIADSEFTQNVNGSATGIYSRCPDNIGRVLGIFGGNFINKVTDSATGIHSSGTQLYFSAANVTNIGSTTATAIYNDIPGQGITLINNARVSFTNTTLVNAGNIVVAGTANIILGERGIIVNNGNYSSVPSLVISGGNQILAGNGIYNGYSIGIFNGIIATTHLSPGNYDNTVGTSSVGTLTINGTQSMSNGFTYDWQWTNFTDGAVNDLIAITNGGLSLGQNFSLNAIYDHSTAQSWSEARAWNLFTTSAGLVFDAATWNTTNAELLADLAKNLSLTNGYFQFINTGNNLQLQFILGVLWDGSFIWKANQTNLPWDNILFSTVWEGDPTRPPGKGDTVQFIRDQTGTANVLVAPAGMTIGNIIIGAGNSNVTGSHHITGGNITLDTGDGSLSTITHTAAAQVGDTLNAGLLIDANGLVIEALSVNALTIGGTIKASKNITVTGGGNLSLTGTTPSHFNLSNLTIDNTHVTHTHTGSGTGIQTSGDITITGASFINNTLSDGGIMSGGNVTLTNVDFHNNFSGSAIGLYLATGALIIDNTGDATFTNNANGPNVAISVDNGMSVTGGAFINNVTDGYGISGGGEITLTNVDFANTVAGVVGINNFGILTLTDGTTFDNTVTAGNGIANAASLIVSASTLTNNVTASTGIDNTGSLTIHNGATLENTVNGGSGINSTGAIDITASTLTNTVSQGRGFYIDNSALILTQAIFTNDIGYATGILLSSTATLAIYDSENLNRVADGGNGIQSQGTIDIAFGNFTNEVTRGFGIISEGQITIAGANFTNNVSGLSTGITKYVPAGGILIDNTIGTRFTQNIRGGYGINTYGHLNIHGGTFLNNVTSGAGIIVSGTANLTLNDVLFVNTGVAGANGIYNNSANAIRITNTSRILNDTTITSISGINAAAGTTLAGNGTYNATLTLAQTTRLSPGGTYNPTAKSIDDTIGTLTLNTAQTWTDGFTYDWQLDAANPASSYDTIIIESTLALGGAYSLNLSALNPQAIAPENYTWTLISTTGGITTPIGTWNYDSSSFLAQLGIITPANLFLSLANNNHDLVLRLATEYIWQENTTGLWSESANWELDPTFNAPGKTVQFIRNQTASTGTVTIDQTTATIGNLTIGSDSGFHTINGNNIVFDAGAGNSSVLSHSANAQAGDSITSNLIVNTNDLSIHGNSTNPLFLNGTIKGSRNVTMTGNLILNTPNTANNYHHVEVRNLTITNANITLIANPYSHGIYVGGGNSLFVEGGNFTNDMPGNGGIGITAEGVNINVTIANLTTFTNNVLGDIGIYTNATNTNLTIANVTTFTNNAGGPRSIGIYTNGTNTNLTIANVTNFTNNASGLYSIGISISRDGTGVLIDNSTVHNLGGSSASAYGIYNYAGILSLQNSTFISTGVPTANAIYSTADGTTRFGENTRILNDTTITSLSAIQVTGNNVLLAGNGTYNAAFTGMRQNTRIKPGSATLNTDHTLSHTPGTLTFAQSQTWDGFTYDWLIADITTPSGSPNSLINITGTLTLNGTSTDYLLNIIPHDPVANIAYLNTDQTYTLITTTGLNLTNGLTLADINANLAAYFADFLAHYSIRGSLNLDIRNNTDLILNFLASDGSFYWRDGQGSGLWQTAANWEANLAPSRPDDIVRLTRNQTAPATITMDNDTTIGELSIGSENGSTTTAYILQGNGTLTLNSTNGESRISHTAYSVNDSIINLDTQLTNNLEIATRPDATNASNQTVSLILNGDITLAPGTSSAHIHKTGAGTLLTTGNINLDTGTFTLEQGHYRLHTGTLTASQLTVRTGSSIGANATLYGNITFDDHAFIKNDSRLGAKYLDKFTVTGNSTFTGASTFINLANFQKTVSADTSRAIIDQQNTFWAGTLTLNATATYTLNLYNQGTYDIQDWTREKDDYGIYYALVLSDNISNFDPANWVLNLTDSSGNLWDTRYWQIVIGTHNNLHGIWLHYTNPNRIPEPSTYAFLLASLVLAAIFIARHKGR